MNAQPQPKPIPAKEIYNDACHYIRLRARQNRDIVLPFWLRTVIVGKYDLLVDTKTRHIIDMAEMAYLSESGAA